MSLISAARTQEPVQDSHSEARTSTLGRKPSQKGTLRISPCVHSFTAIDPPPHAGHGSIYWRSNNDQGRWVPDSHTPTLARGKADSKLRIKIKHLFISAELRTKTYR